MNTTNEATNMLDDDIKMFKHLVLLALDDEKVKDKIIEVIRGREHYLK